MKLEICSFSGYKIYPSKGKVYVRTDSRVSKRKRIYEKKDRSLNIHTFRFINGKAESYFLQRLSPRKIRWTQIYRRLNKKGITEQIVKKRTRRTVKAERAVAGATWDEIRAKRNEKPEVRAAARQAAIEKTKEKAKAKGAQKATK